MAREIGQRLESLKARRSGTDRVAKTAQDQFLKSLEAATYADSYQKRSPGKQSTEYALGAMQEVGPQYTARSVETAQRVGNQLEKGLSDEGLSVEFRLQGSVPANIHIRGYSDIDLLVLRGDFLTYERAGALARAGYYSSPTNRSTAEVLLELRASSAKILKATFPAADVDTSGGKAVKISGGSLSRDVDVVPSHWYDNIAYQTSYAEADRGVSIYDRKTYTALENFPFKHIQLLDQRDTATSSGLKKAIRLCKNVKCDADREIALTSFDVASLMYHADLTALARGSVYELGILAEAERFLDFLFHNPGTANALKVPDGSRLILDTQAKRDALTALSLELDALGMEVTKEQTAAYRLYDPDLATVRRVLSETYISPA